jgi:hypothetical protein
MKYLIVILSILAFSCFNKKDNSTIEAYSIEWNCPAPNWITKSNLKLYEGDNKKLAENCFFIEPVNTNHKLPDSIGLSGDIVKLAGQFTMTKRELKEVRVFKYTSYKIVKANRGGCDVALVCPN